LTSTAPAAGLTTVASLTFQPGEGDSGLKWVLLRATQPFQSGSVAWARLPVRIMHHRPPRMVSVPMDGSPTFSEPTGVAVADFNEGGERELVTVHGEGARTLRLVTWQADTDASLSAIGGYVSASGTDLDSPGEAYAGDFDGDTHQDVLAVQWWNSSGADASAQVFYGGGAGDFTAGDVFVLATATATGPCRAFGGTAGNVDADLPPELFVACLDPPGQLRVDFANRDAPAITLVRDLESFDMELLDLNGDGALDLVAGDDELTGSRRGVSVWLNDGDGGFTHAGEYHDFANPGLGIPRSLSLADVDGDGSDEVLITAQLSASGYVHVMSNDGSGVLSRTRAIETASDPWRTELIDITGDGINDLVEASFNFAYRISVALAARAVDGTPLGNYRPWRDNLPGPTVNRDMLTGALTSSGRELVLVPGHLGVTPAINMVMTGGGNTSQPFESTTLELLLDSLNMAADTVAMAAVASASTDGHDLWVASNQLCELSGMETVSPSRVCSEFPDTAIVASDMVAADLDADGTVDFALVDTSSNVAVIVTNRDERQVFPVGSEPGPPVISDFDGDGFNDLWVPSGFDIYVFMGQSSYGRPNAKFDEIPRLFTPGEVMEEFQLTDVDADGLADLVGFPVNTFQINRYEVSGAFAVSTGDIVNVSSAFVEAPASTCDRYGTYVQDAAPGDFDGDGALDLLVYATCVDFGGFTGGFFALIRGLLESGSTGVQPPSGQLSPPTESSQVTDIDDGRMVSLDIDGDGDVDGVVLLSNPRPMLLLRNDGAGNFAVESTATTLAGEIRGAQVGDFNGDRIPDIAAATWNRSSTRVAVEIIWGRPLDT
jgi:hypothetical protein